MPISIISKLILTHSPITEKRLFSFRLSFSFSQYLNNGPFRDLEQRLEPSCSVKFHRQHRGITVIKRKIGHKSITLFSWENTIETVFIINTKLLTTCIDNVLLNESKKKSCLLAVFCLLSLLNLLSHTHLVHWCYLDWFSWLCRTVFYKFLPTRLACLDFLRVLRACQDLYLEEMKN